MRFIWKVPQSRNDKAPHGQEALGAAPEKGQDFKEQQENLKAYFEALKKQGLDQKDQKERTDFRKKLEQWDAAGNVEEIRRGGVTEKENLQNPLARHSRLASEFLQQLESAGKLTFKVNFHGNQLAYHKVGAADMLPPNVRAISVKKADGSFVSERAVRGLNPNTGRIGYYDEKLLSRGIYQYAPVYDGDAITILETGAMPAMGSPDSMKEHMEIYGNHSSRGYGAMDDRASESVENLPGKSKTAQPDLPAPLKAKKAKEKAQEKGSTRSQLAQLRAQLPPVAPAEAAQPLETAEKRRNLVQTALSYLDPEKGKFFQENYYSKNPIYNGGRVGCAITSTTMLQESGNINFTNPGVDFTERQLRGKGWTGVPWRPGIDQPGDVIIWRRNRADGTEAGRHIGIIVGPNEVIHNAIDRKKGETYHRPHKTPIAGYDKFAHGGTITIWRQPGYISAANQQETGQSQTSARPQEVRDNEQNPIRSKYNPTEMPKFAAAIERATARWLPIIQEKCEKYGIPQYVGFIQAIMFQESGGRPELVGKNSNGTEDRGLMQLNSRYFNAPNIFDPEVNIGIGVENLAGLLKRFNGNIIDVSAAYNCGHPEGLAKGKSGAKWGIPNSTKYAYVPNILYYLKAMGSTGLPEQGDMSNTLYA